MFNSCHNFVMHTRGYEDERYVRLISATLRFIPITSKICKLVRIIQTDSQFKLIVYTPTRIIEVYFVLNIKAESWCL